MLQFAPIPHVLRQGSTHLFLTHALFCGQSVFIKHSGLQPKYGSPEYPGKQVHSPSLHFVLDPQGEGLQRSVSIISEKKKQYVFYF